jgi:hypothetical protein
MKRRLPKIIPKWKSHS